MALIGTTVAEAHDLSDEVLSEGEQQEAEAEAENLHNDDTEEDQDQGDQDQEEGEHILVVDENTDLNK